MLSNLWSEAEKDCLLGVAIWGDTAKLNMISLFSKCIKELGFSTQKVREIYYLFDLIEGMGARTGWELVVCWDQNANSPTFDIGAYAGKILEPTF